MNAFINSYAYTQKPLLKDNVADAVAVLEKWRESKGFEGDYAASKEALELFDVLGMRGCVYYVDGAPAGWCLGEPLAKGRMFAVHFEKGMPDCEGIYKEINAETAALLRNDFTYINRPDDRQAADMTTPLGPAGRRGGADAVHGAYPFSRRIEQHPRAGDRTSALT